VVVKLTLGWPIVILKVVWMQEKPTSERLRGVNSLRSKVEWDMGLYRYGWPVVYRKYQR